MSAGTASTDRHDRQTSQAGSCRRTSAGSGSRPDAWWPPAEVFPARFDSILGHHVEEVSEPPAFFVDPELDQIVAAITAGKDEYNLRPFFHSPLRDIDGIAFRHEVMRDLERPEVLDDIKTFAAAMRAVREHLTQAEKLHVRRQKERWVLDAASIYCDAITRLAGGLSRAGPTSRGLSGFAEQLARYVASERFVSLRQQTEKLLRDLATIHYTVLINGSRVEVRHYGSEADYSAEVEATFRKFHQGVAGDFAFSFSDSPDMNHIEAAILEQVERLYPELFSELAAFVEQHRNFADPAITKFDREIQFYIAHLEYMARFKKAELSFCYPRMTEASKEIYAYEGFDLALAGHLVREDAVPVCNDFYLRGQERIIVVSGPNQGGKTTFARTFGQLHYFASLGCPVPGRKAQLFLFDRLFTHFEREEDIADLRGKLEDDLIRIHAILESATPRSIIILNEIFTSTTFRDARLLSRKVAKKLVKLDLLCVWVTFIDELASLGEKTVSMVSTVAPENPAERTFKIVRRPVDGLAYALSIAEKYRLTYDAIKERFRS